MSLEAVMSTRDFLLGSTVGSDLLDDNIWRTISMVLSGYQLSYDTYNNVVTVAYVFLLVFFDFDISGLTTSFASSTFLTKELPLEKALSFLKNQGEHFKKLTEFDHKLLGNHLRLKQNNIDPFYDPAED